MNRIFRIALLAAALPLLSQDQAKKKAPDLLRFTLRESPDRLIELLGRPDRIDDSSPVYQSWQYDFPADEPHDDNSPAAWFVCIQSGSHEVLSVTRNFGEPQDVASLFPAAETEVHHWPSSESPRFSLHLRRLSGDALLLAMGTAAGSTRTTQLILIRRSALKRFIPWLAEQLQ